MRSGGAQGDPTAFWLRASEVPALFESLHVVTRRISAEDVTRGEALRARCEGERERARETDRQREGGRERKRQRGREGEGRQRQLERERETERETERQRGEKVYEP